MRGQLSHQLSSGDGFIDSSLYVLEEELQRVNEFLSNPNLFMPFEEAFDESIGRLVSKYLIPMCVDHDPTELRIENLCNSMPGQPYHSCMEATLFPQIREVLRMFRADRIKAFRNLEHCDSLEGIGRFVDLFESGVPNNSSVQPTTEPIWS